MCGIAGIYAYQQQETVDRNELLQIRDAMLQRGPDDAGLWIATNESIGLAFRRLAIIDLAPRSNQPMVTTDGLYRIVFNGEIYNYQDLKGQLIAKGYHFQTTSDTEVLLYLYADQGVAMFNQLRGMFDLALWDEAKQSLVLARDQFGIKPLYYANDGKILRFASQVKALLKSSAIKQTRSAAGIVGFFLWGHIPEPFTLYQEIQSLPAGSYLVANKDGVKIIEYFNLPDLYRTAESNPVETNFAEAQEIIYAAVQDSVKHHLIADVPVGVFLSSGIDSAVITRFAAQHAKAKLHTLTLGFTEYQNTPRDEVPLAEATAKLYHTAQHSMWLNKEAVLDDFPVFLNAMDQPSIDGANTYFVSKMAHQVGLKVVLSGLGGDEFLGGYSDFQRLPKMVQRLRYFAALGPAIRTLLAPLAQRYTKAKYASLVEFGNTIEGAYLLSRCLLLPWQLPDYLDPEIVMKGLAELNTLPLLNNSTRDIHDPFLKISLLTASWYMRNQLLRDSDWASMAHSLELRVPFVDIDFVKTVLPLAAIRSKVKKDIFNNTSLLPEEIITRKKTGFNIPIAEWAVGSNSNRSLMTEWAKKVYGSFNFVEHFS